jgi:hypothetical protein
MTELDILHCFADTGAENPALSRYGNILRLSWDVTPNEYSEAVQCDVTQLPLTDDAQFDIGWFHPPCGGVSPMSDTGSGSRDDWPDLIPEAREVAQQHCDHYVIENKPRDSLDAEVVLSGQMFNLGIEYERAFETSFPVDQPPEQSDLAETSTFFYTEWSKGEWAAAKGTDIAIADKQHIAKNTIPAAYIDHIMRHYARATDDVDRPDYSDYDKQMETKRRKEANHALGTFN